MRNAFVNTLIDCARQAPAVALFLMAEVGFSVVEPFEKESPRVFIIRASRNKTLC